MSAHEIVALKPGTKGSHNGKDVEVLRTVGPDKILIVGKKASEPQLISVEHFKVEQQDGVGTAPAIHDHHPDWDEAERRFAIIEPLVEPGRSGSTRTNEEVRERALLAQVHPTTIYRWIRDYECAGNRPSGLKPRTKNRGSRKPLLDPVVEAILVSAIQDLYLNKQQRSMIRTYKGLVERCAAAGLKTPHYNTLRKRINAIPARERLSRRARRKIANDTYEPRPGSFVVDRPWQLVEVDHTPGDIILVDQTHRRDVGRPTITAAIDVYSRMIVGFQVGFEPPSAATAGLCLKNAMLPKGPWLAVKGVNLEWPCFGRPAELHVDNAMEFRGKMLHRACREYKIALNFRPLKTPEYGGHIEAFFKTLSRKIHELPGTTFFDVEHRGEYPSERKASMTLDDFEKWLIHTIFEYHEDFHSGIKCSPKSRYAEAFMPNGDSPPLATPEIPEDPERLGIDFSPYEERTIQKYGVQFWKIHYYHPVMKKFINAKALGSKGSKQRFRFHYDPRDISHIYFYHPDLKQYFPIPYSNITNPRMSAHEVLEADRYLRKLGKSKIDERAIVECVKKRRAIETEAAAKTKRARRNSERVRTGQGAVPRLSLVKNLPLKVVSAKPVEPRILKPYAIEDL